MAKWCLISDLHWGARSDLSVMIEHQQKFYEDVFFPLIDREGVTAVWILGDLVDRRKYANLNTLHAMRQTVLAPLRQRFKDRGLVTFVLPGNHDMPFRESMRANAVTQLVPSSPAFQCITEPSVVEFDGYRVSVLPWICEENHDKAMRLMQARLTPWLFGHLELKNFETSIGQVQLTGMDRDEVSAFDLVCSGHYHHISRQGNVQYLGAPVELTWADYKDPRGCWLFDPATAALEFVENPHRVFFRFIYDDAGKDQSYVAQFLDFVRTQADRLRHVFIKVIVKSKTQPYWYDLAMDALQKCEPFQLTAIEDSQAPLTDDSGDLVSVAAPSLDTAMLIDQHVTGMITDVPMASAVQTAMRELYAQAVDIRGRQ